MVRIGMVGVGGYGANVLRGAIAAEGIVIAGVCDTNPKAAAAAAEKAGAPIVSSLDELLADDSIQGIVLVVPNPLHRTMLEQVVAAGRHVYVEKPIANTLADAIPMVRAAKEAGRVLMVGHNTRRANSFRAAKRMLDAGDLGQLVAMEANFSHSGGFGITPESWRYRRETCPAVPLIQLGVHCIDTMGYYAGPVRRVSSFMRASILPDNEDTTVMLLEYDSGILATLQSHYVIPGTNFIRLYGTDANLHVEWDRIEKTIRRPYGTELIPFEENDTQREEMDEFARCIETGAAPETDGAGAVQALAVVEAAIQSATGGGRPVSIRVRT